MKSIESAWSAVREHPAFRAGAVYAGSAFVLLQVMDLLGVPTGVIRWTVAILALGFLATTSVLALVHQRGGGLARAAARLPGGRRLAVALLLLFAVGSGAWWAGARLMGATVAPGAERIAVLPFTTSGAGALELGEGMVDLLATAFDQVGGVRAVHPRTVMHRWSRHAGPGGQVDLAGMLEVGREVGAGSVLLGSVVQAGGRVRLSAELLTLDGTRIGEARTEGPVDSVLALVDDLAVRMLREVWRSSEPVPNLRLAAITTPSLQALEAYLRGERFYRASSWDSAAAAFQEAVREDSTFALAYLRLGEAYGWMYAHGHPDAVAASRRAAELSDRLPARDRDLVVAHLLHEEGSSAALDTLQSYVRRYPDDAMGWYLLGDVRFHAAVIEGLSPEAQSAPIDSVVRLDPTLAAPLYHLLELNLNRADSAEFYHRLRQYEAAGGDGAVWRRAGEIHFAPADSFVERFARGYREVDVGRANALTWHVWSAAPVKRPDLDPDLTLEALERVEGVERQGTHALSVREARIGALLTLGRVAEAKRLADEATGGPPRWSPFGSFFTAAVAGMIPPEEALKRLPSNLGPQEVWIRTILDLAWGNPAAARDRGLFGDMEELPPEAPSWVGGSLVIFQGWATLLEGDTLAGHGRIRAGLEMAGYGQQAGNSLAPVLFRWAELLASDDEHRQEGIARLESLENRVGGPLLGPLHLALGEAYEAEGRTEDAARHYAELVRLWTDADPALQPRVAAARRALERLTSEGP